MHAYARSIIGFARFPGLMLTRRFPFRSFHCGIGVARYIRALTVERAPFSRSANMGLRTRGRRFHAWLEDWISGVDLWKRPVVLEDKVIVNPFTKQVHT
jgi:hypothetical protein